MKVLKMFLAGLAGFLLCYLIFPPHHVKASGLVRVTTASVNNLTNPVGGNVVGFSCTGTGINVECFIATQ